MLNVKKILTKLLNRVNDVGTYYYTSSADKSVGAATVSLCSLTLPKGVYIIRGMFGPTTSTTVLRNISFTLDPQPDPLPRSIVRWDTSSGGGDFVVALYKFDAETTVTLQGYCTSTITLRNISIEAIKIK